MPPETTYIPSKAKLFLESLKKSYLGHALQWSNQGRIIGRWNQWEISSSFQPIQNNDRRDTLGYQAFARCQNQDGSIHESNHLLSLVHDSESITYLDRLLRTVHLLNFILSPQNEKKLFLNVHDALVWAVSDNHGSAFRKVVDALGFSSKKIVIELPVSLSKNPQHLGFVLQNYHLNALNVAINIESLEDWLTIANGVRANYLKIDRQHISGPNQLRQLTQILNDDPTIKIIITNNSQYFNQIEHPRIYTQGLAYGNPECFVTHPYFPPREVSINPHLFIGG